MVIDGQCTRWCKNIAENFNRVSRAHKRCRRQTDGRTTTYSERELEFTFAKKLAVCKILHPQTFTTRSRTHRQDESIMRTGGGITGGEGIRTVLEFFSQKSTVRYTVTFRKGEIGLLEPRVKVNERRLRPSFRPVLHLCTMSKSLVFFLRSPTHCDHLQNS